MFYLFVGCAVFGGTIMVLQMLLTLVGLAGDALHVDVPQDAGGHDLSGDFHGDASGNFQGDAHGDLQGQAGGEYQSGHGTSTLLFKMLSVRAIVAAMAFFGLAGLAADAGHLSPLATLGVALAAGAAAMYGVFRMMQALSRLRCEGTARIQRAIGQEATVYLRIPANRSAVGKVLVDVQNRTMEYSALTSGPELATGTKVIVVDVISQDTLEVSALDESAPGASEIEERKSYA